MPLLALLNAAFCNPIMQDQFSVRRREAKVGDFGRGYHSDTTMPGIYGVVVPATEGTDRERDYATSGKTLNITTRFQLRDQVRYVLPDIVTWGGDEYVCLKVTDMTRYGFVEAVCVCQDLATAAPGKK